MSLLLAIALQLAADVPPPPTVAARDVVWASIGENFSEGPFPKKSPPSGARAVVDCRFGSSGRLTDCSVVDESIVGAGETGLAKARRLTAEAQARDGKPVAGRRVLLTFSWLSAEQPVNPEDAGEVRP